MKKSNRLVRLLLFILIIFFSFNFLSAGTPYQKCCDDSGKNYWYCNQGNPYYGCDNGVLTPCGYNIANCDGVNGCDTTGRCTWGGDYRSDNYINWYPAQYCGNGACESAYESCSSCPGDCGACVLTTICPVNAQGSCSAGTQNWVSIWPLTCIDNSVYITQVKQCTSPTCINPQTQSCSGTIYTCSTPQLYQNCTLTGQACSAGVCVGSSTNVSTWTNLKGDIISTSQVGDTVRMLVSGSGFDLNQKINYTVYKNTTFLYFFKSVTPLSTILSSETWTSSETANSVFFKAKASLSESTSNSMDITSANNAMPVVSIVSPDNLFRGSVDYPISFTQNSSDEDDLLKITWNFGDNTNYSIVNYSLVGTPSLANINRNYSSAGVYIVKLTASEMNRPQSNSAYRTVYIFKPGINVIPVITSPVDGLVYTNWVKFNSSQSFVANCSTNLNRYDFFAGKLQCEYLHAPGNKTISGYNLSATWTVKDLDGSVVSGFPISGKWQQNYTQVVEFSKYFPTAARRSAYLTLDYESG